MVRNLPPRLWPLVALAGLGVALVISVIVVAASLSARGPAASSIGGPFRLIDQSGKTVTEADYAGKPFLVFFGYTHCPDVCPTMLADMTQILTALGTSQQIAVLFITVDPARDTPSVLKEYLSDFDPRIVGLTGDEAAVTTAEKAYRVYSRKVPGQNGDYSMDHTAVVYLMDRDGRFVNALNLEQPPSDAAAELRRDLQGSLKGEQFRSG